MNHDALNQIDIRRMRTVIEVARAEAITTAAQTLGLTQSAVSRIVAELEEALGQRLFERLPRGIQLTDAGRRFVDRARCVLADIDDLIAEVAAPPGRLSGRLRLGIAATGAHAICAIGRFASTHPDVAIETVHASEQTLCPRLVHGELDLVIGSSSYLRRWREIEITMLAPLHFACMLRRDHPLSRLSTPTEADVLAFPLILPESVELTYADIAQRYARHGLPLVKPHYVTNNLELVTLLLRRTDAFFPLMFPEETFGGLGESFLLLRGVVDLPVHHVSSARAAQSPRRQLVELFESELAATFGCVPRASTLVPQAL